LTSMMVGVMLLLIFS